MLIRVVHLAELLFKYKNQEVLAVLGNILV
jgi:hypothetical protein